MVSFKSLSLLALVGSAIAAPHVRHGSYRGGKKVVWHTVVHTAYVTVYPGAPKPAEPTPTVVYEQPSPKPVTTVKKIRTRPSKPKPKPKPTTSSVYVAPPVKPKPIITTTKSPVYEPEPTPEPAPEPSPKPEPEPTPPKNDGYMAIVDEWRAKLGLKPLQRDAQLEANAAKTCREGNGKMVHQLNPGSMGQVLAPGGPEDFYHVFVGGWLCELPNMAGMNGVCTEASKGWYYTSTGHADILTSDKYVKIGCASEGQITGCDLA